MLPGLLAVFLTVFSLADSKQKDFYSFKVVNSRGKLVSLEKYRGSVRLINAVYTGDVAASSLTLHVKFAGMNAALGSTFYLFTL